MFEREKEEIVNYGIKLLKLGLTNGTGGNISILVEKNKFLISPSGIDYLKTTVDDIVLMDLNGNILSGKRKPSSEYLMHCFIYNNIKEAGAIVHTHSLYATAYSSFRRSLPATNYIICDLGGKDVRCAKYETFGTEKLGEAVVEALLGSKIGNNINEKNLRKVCFLANHGSIAYDKTIDKAFNNAKNLEWLTKVHMIGKSIENENFKQCVLDENEINEVIKRGETYGQ